MQVPIAIACAAALTVASCECFRVLQAASYRPRRGYFKIFFTPYFVMLVVVQAAALALLRVQTYYTLPFYVAMALCAALRKRKCKLALTPRVTRMMLVFWLCASALCVFVGVAYWVCAVPLLTLASWLICLPIDCAIARRYIRKARRKLQCSGATVIAITGSYGKTSVKDMLSALLDGSVAPKGSCNTPLGIAKFINGTDLSGAKYVVLEFGARCKGDIACLCKLYKPSCGIVTGVCMQHLSTFGSLSGIVATKRELVEQLPDGGFCVLNAADPIARSFANVGVCSTILSDSALSVQACAVNFTGTILRVEGNGEQYTMRLPQIAEWCAQCFALCACAAQQLGQPLAVTVANASAVRQTPHRLQLYPFAKGYILDDSYNGSIVGVRSCCATLGHFDCAKVVITQGLAECGAKQWELNVQCGELLGNACDVAVVSGKNSKALVEGLLRTNCRICRANNLSQAVEMATKHLDYGILLFQNDLPDVVNI